MASNYTGDDTATQAPSPTPAKNANPIAVLPSDGDALNAASVAQAFKMLADAADFNFDRTAVLDSANVFAAQQDFAGGWQDSTTPTTWQQSFVLLGGALGKTRLHYGSGSWSLSVNASFNDGTALWSSDNNAVESYRVALGGGTVQIAYHAATAGTWADGAWTSGPTILTVGDLFTSNNVTATGAIIGGTGVTATTGNVTATAGNLVATAGDPASDQARVKAKQFVMAGSAPTIAKGPGLIGVGVDGAVAMVAGSLDTRGSFTATSGAVPTNGVIVTVTFNKAYPSAPVVVVSPTNAATTDLLWTPYVATTTTTFTISSTVGNPLGAGVPYGWTYTVIG